MHLQKIILIAYLSFLNINYIVFSQTIIDPNVSLNDLGNNLIGSSILYSNLIYDGSDSARAIFTSIENTDIELKEGICLSSGRIKYASGPNSINDNLSFVNGTFGDFLLSSLINQSQTWDAAILEFDFVPANELISLNFFFASEEYPEWADVNKDLIGIFLSGPNPNGLSYQHKNIANIPNTDLPICVLNINDVIPSYPEYYIDNSYGQHFAYDGLTTVFSPFVNVYPDSSYHLRIGIADENDSYYDSGLFIEKQSFKSVGCASFTKFIFKETLNFSLFHDINGLINSDSILLFVPYNTNVTQMTSSFILPPETDAYVNNELQISDTSVNNFTQPLIYSLFCNNGNSSDWTVIVNFLPNNQSELLEYVFLAENNPNLNYDLNGELIGRHLNVYAPASTDLSNLIATFSLSDNAIAFVEDTVQQSGITPNDFSDTLQYIIEAENGDTSHYYVTVNLITELIERTTDPQIYVYPNPNNGNFIVRFQESVVDNLLLEIYSTQNKIVHSQEILYKDLIDSQIKVQSTDLISGIYLLKVSGDNFYFSQKLIIH